jgi:hypothetical protein
LPATVKLTFVDDELAEAIVAGTASDDDSVHEYLPIVLPFAVNELFKVEVFVGSVIEEALQPALTVEALLTYTIVVDDVAVVVPLVTVKVTA